MMSGKSTNTKFSTPFRGAIAHLALIGIIPAIFLVKILCASNTCSALQQFVLNDYMCRFLLWYSTALVAAITIRSTGGDANNLCLRRLNRSLTVISCLNVLGIVWLHQLSQVTVESRYFVVLLSCHVLAISISVWSCQPTTLPTSKQPAKWSMPGTALFGALSLNCVAVFASVQLLKSPEGILLFIDSTVRNQVTPEVTATFALSTLQSLWSVILLKSLRDSMSLRQLRVLCIFKFISSLVLLFVWLPEQSPLVRQVYTRLILGGRIAVTIIYLLGYLFAGTADNIGTILSSEKDA